MKTSIFSFILTATILTMSFLRCFFSSGLRNVNRENKTAEMSFKGKWFTGCIKTIGTFKFN
jgi:hypothetical protein